MSNGASPSGKAAGFGPAIPEVRILPPQPLKSSRKRAFLLRKDSSNPPLTNMTFSHICSAECPSQNPPD